MLYQSQYYGGMVYKKIGELFASLDVDALNREDFNPIFDEVSSDAKEVIQNDEIIIGWQFSDESRLMISENSEHRLAIFQVPPGTGSIDYDGMCKICPDCGGSLHDK